MKEDFREAIEDRSQIGSKIEQTQITCQPNVKPLMDDDLISELDNSSIPHDLMDDNNMF